MIMIDLPAVRYYLGIPVQLVDVDVPWIVCRWPDGREFKHWPGQLLKTPWGDAAGVGAGNRSDVSGLSDQDDGNASLPASADSSLSDSNESEEG